MTQLTPSQAFHEAQRLLRMGDYPRAGSLTQQLVQNLPDEPAIRGLHGAALARLGRSMPGIVLMQQALDKADDDRVRQFLAVESSTALRRVNRREEALEMAERAVGFGTPSLDALAAKAEALIDLGRLDDAMAFVTASDNDDSPGLAIAWGRACLLSGSPTEGIERVMAATKRVGVSAVELGRLLRLLGQLCERTGRTEEAFDAWRRAAKLSQGEFDSQGHRKVVDGLIERYTPESIKKVTHAEGIGDENVFLIGPPGAGSELVQNIIASHPKGFGCGEIGVLATVCRGKLGAEQTSFRRVVQQPTRLRGKQLTEAGHAYADEVRKLCAEDITRIVDAQESNVYHAGVLPMMMPNAKIVLCVREPIESALATFAAVTGTTYARDLEDLGLYTRDIVNLCDHWRTLFAGLGVAAHEVRYEDLVSKTEPTVRALLNYVGLDFDAACLSPESNATLLLEPSDEARLPMNKQIHDRAATCSTRTKSLRTGLGIG